jgi:hypothetical protein
MESYLTQRKAKYQSIAHSLESASVLYKKAAESLDTDDGNNDYYSYIKEANELIDLSFPERKNYLKSKYSANKSHGVDWQVISKFILPIACVLFLLVYLVLSGTTGDMTKSWNIEDVKKNSAYPKND